MYQKFELTIVPPTVSAPTKDACSILWDKYSMPDHIREHSTAVAKVAHIIAEALAKKAYPIDTATATSAALLHDIAKIYCINHGGSHALTGANWILHDLNNFAIAQATFYHNCLDSTKVSLPLNILPALTMYSDARVKHSTIVSVQERYEDLSIRYGSTPQKKQHIENMKMHALTIEKMLANILGFSINTLTSKIK